MPPENSKPSRTPAQIAASRINGAKSKGPITAAGKAIVAGNPITHGFRAESVTLANEDAATYNTLLDNYLRRYAPKDQVESDLVGLLASNMWQVMRCTSIEVALFNLAVTGLNDEKIAAQFNDMDECGRLAIAFKQDHKEHALELLRRYKSTAERAYHRALQAIEQISKDRNDNTSAPNQSQPRTEPQEVLSAEQTQAPEAVSRDQAAKLETSIHLEAHAEAITSKTTPQLQPFLVVKNQPDPQTPPSKQK